MGVANVCLKFHQTNAKQLAPREATLTLLTKIHDQKRKYYSSSIPSMFFYSHTHMHRLFFISICVVQITHLKFNQMTFHTASKSALLIADQVMLVTVSRIALGGVGGGGGVSYT